MARDKTDKTDKTPAMTPATWGIPDWRDEAAYGDVELWSLDRWRWEFFRRRADVRAFFDERAEPQYQEDLATWQTICAEREPTASEYEFFSDFTSKKPDDPRFRVRLPPDYSERFGFMPIFNPRTGDVSEWKYNSVEKKESYRWAIDGARWKVVKSRTTASDGHMVIAFDANRPLAKQIADAAAHLKNFQENHLKSRPKQRRRHPAKWLGYLRTLDAREDNATWREIADLHPNTAGTEQTARDAWKAANDLRFNF